MTHPLVSVVIPCYNRARYVREAVDSALAQTYRPLEVIAVDDGSTDGTLSVLRSYGSLIQVLSQPNTGVAVARNVGIERAGGEWIALLDSDDAWLPDKVSQQVAAARRWPEAALLHTLCETMDADSFPLTPKSSLSVEPDRLEEDALARLLSHCYPTTSSVMIRRDVLRECGLFDAAFERSEGCVAEDWDLYLRLAERYSFARVSRALVRYRVHGDSKTLADRLPHTQGLVAVRRRIESKREQWQAERGPEMAAALEIHRRSFAHVYGRLGLLYQKRRQFRAAQEAFAAACRLEPERLKHRLRWLWMTLASACAAFGEQVCGC